MTTGEIKHIVAQLKNKPVTWQMRFYHDLKPMTLNITSKDNRFNASLELTEPHEQVSAKIYRFIAMTKDHPA
jgi:hypothetical protein